MSDVVSLDIAGAWLITNPIHGDNRGFFREWFKQEMAERALGRKFNVAQSNISQSKKGVVRGIHYSQAPEGQAKWVTCSHGAIWDVVVDIRPNSPTFKKWIAQELRAEDGRSVLIGEGLGHAFVALEEDSAISYLLSSPYSPNFEFAINPLDEEIDIKWPIEKLFFSERDSNAPRISELFR